MSENQRQLRLDTTSFRDAMAEPIAEDAAALLGLVATVDHLRRGRGPRLSVSEALEQALRWWVADWSQRQGSAAPSPWPAPPTPDWLLATLELWVKALAEPGALDAATSLTQALTRWSSITNDRAEDARG